MLSVQRDRLLNESMDRYHLYNLVQPLMATVTNAASVCEKVLWIANDSIQKYGKFRVGISGGSLPNTLSGLVHADTDWSKWYIFYVDERLCPLNHADSNHRLAHEALLSQVPIPKENIFTLNEELCLFPKDAAADYQSRMKSHFGNDVFDLLLLGVGPDGHTASLFPGHDLLQETFLSVASITDSPKPPSCRITLTLPVILSSKHLLFVAFGASKADILKQILVDKNVHLPATLVTLKRPDTQWLIDADAAKFLK